MKVRRDWRTRRKAWATFLVLCALLMSWVPVKRVHAATILYVSVPGGGDCRTWQDACDLQDALAAAVAGDEIWVGVGTYRPTSGTDRRAAFVLKDRVALYGGFLGTETARSQRDWKAYPTILDGDIGQMGDSSDNSYNVVRVPFVWGGNPKPILDGFTIAGGNANAHESLSAVYRIGGGMNSGSGSPVLANVIFSGNAARYQGGGLSSQNGHPVLVNVTFVGNSARIGGGLDVSSATLINATLSGNSARWGGAGALGVGDGDSVLINVSIGHNHADDMGGGIYHTGGNLTLVNSLLWGNTAEERTQIYPLSGDLTISHSLVQSCGGSGAGWDASLGTDGGGNIDADPLFLDADGRDGVVGTLDDDLRLGVGSPAVDAGDVGALPDDVLDLDGDGDVAEPLPFDRAGNARRTGVSVDIGAYEMAAERCYSGYIYSGQTSLVSGKEYREDFHVELGGTANVTLADALESYESSGLGHLAAAERDYKTALFCATAAAETDAALTGLLNARWELATGAMLSGNEWMVKALDVVSEHPANPLEEEMDQLREAIDWYAQATGGYGELLTSEHYADVLRQQRTRVDPLKGEQSPYLDLQRLALAAAKKSRAYLELAERQFRVFTPESKSAAQETLRQGFQTAAADLTRLDHVWPGAADDASYQALTRNLSDMQHLFRTLQEGQNPYGYSSEYVPFFFDPDKLPQNNYEQTKTLADDELEEAQTQVDSAQGRQQEADDNWTTLQQRLSDVRVEYDGELEEFCGTDDDHEVDLDACNGGTIATQVLAIETATQRAQLVLQQMETQNAWIDIEQRRAAKVAGIQRATARLIDPDNPDPNAYYSDLMSQKSKTSTAGQILQGLSQCLSGAISGFSAGGKFGPQGAVVGGIVGTLGSLTGFVGGQLDDEPPKQEKLAEFQAWQDAQVQYAEAEITDADSKALIRQYMLRFKELDIELNIALSNLQQEIARLDAMKTRVEYLLAQKAEAEVFTEAMYRDPAGRVLRDYYMELASDRFEVALRRAWQAGRALEYEINEPWADLDSLYRVHDIYTLSAALAQMNTSYNDWMADNPSAQLSEDVIYLSQALGFENAYDADLGRIVTREEKFSAFVRDPAHWVDLDEDGEKESLQFTFQTSIYRGNRFFSTSVFNDKIASIQARVRGKRLGDERAVIGIKQSGTSYIRTAADEIREYNVRPWTALIAAATNDSELPEAVAVNKELATRSVAFTSWTLTLDKVNEPTNADLDITGIDEIELTVRHERYTLQSLGGLDAQGKDDPDFYEPPPNRAYRPMETVIDPLPLALSLAEPANLSPATAVGPGDLTDGYFGTLVITQPVRMPTLEFSVVLTATADGRLSGYIDAADTLAYPIVGASGKGPALSGAWLATEDTKAFYLESVDFRQVMSDTMLLRKVRLSGPISDGGELLSGEYFENTLGLTWMESVLSEGSFELRRPVHPIEVVDTEWHTYLPIVLYE